MKFAVKVVSSAVLTPANVLPIQQSNIFLSDFPIQIREASFPCVLRPCPCGVICSNWGNLAGFPKRSFNPFTPANSFLHIATHSPLFSVSITAKKLGSFIAIFRHSLAAGSCTSYDKKLLPLVEIFYLPWLHFFTVSNRSKMTRSCPPLTIEFILADKILSIPALQPKRYLLNAFY